MWDLETKQKMCEFPGEIALFNTANNDLAVVQGSNRIVFYEIKNCQPIKSIRGGDHVNTLAYSPNGTFLAFSGYFDKVLYFYSVDNETIYRPEGDFPKSIEYMSFSPNGENLLIVGKKK